MLKFKDKFFDINLSILLFIAQSENKNEAIDPLIKIKTKIKRRPKLKNMYQLDFYAKNFKSLLDWKFFLTLFERGPKFNYPEEKMFYFKLNNIKKNLTEIECINKYKKNPCNIFFYHLSFFNFYKERMSNIMLRRPFHIAYGVRLNPCLSIYAAFIQLKNAYFNLTNYINSCKNILRNSGILEQDIELLVFGPVKKIPFNKKVPKQKTYITFNSLRTLNLKNLGLFVFNSNVRHLNFKSKNIFAFKVYPNLFSYNFEKFDYQYIKKIFFRNDQLLYFNPLERINNNLFKDLNNVCINRGNV